MKISVTLPESQPTRPTRISVSPLSAAGGLLMTVQSQFAFEDVHAAAENNWNIHFSDTNIVTSSGLSWRWCSYVRILVIIDTFSY